MEQKKFEAMLTLIVPKVIHLITKRGVKPLPLGMGI